MLLKDFTLNNSKGFAAQPPLQITSFLFDKPSLACSGNPTGTGTLSIYYY